MSAPVGKRPEVAEARKAVRYAEKLRDGSNSITRAYREGVLTRAKQRLREMEARALSGEAETVEPEIRGVCVCGAPVVTINAVLMCAHGHE